MCVQENIFFGQNIGFTAGCICRSGMYELRETTALMAGRKTATLATVVLVEDGDMNKPRCLPC